MPFDLHALVRGATRTLGRALAGRARVDQLGAGVVFSGAPRFENLGRIEIGDEVAISSLPVQSHFVTGPGALIRLGARVTIGAGAAITAHTRVEIDDDAHLGAGVVIMDTDFHATGDHGSAGGVAPVHIGAGARLGDRVTVLKGARIGRGARVAAGSVVNGEIPDGALAKGVPARVVTSLSGGAPSPVEGMDSTAIHERVAAIVAATFHAAEVSFDDGPGTVRGWDSLGSLRLLVAIEEAFGIIVPEAMMARAKTVRAIGDEVAAQLGRAS